MPETIDMESRVAELTAKYGRVKHVVFNGTDLVFRKAKRAECQAHVQKGYSEDASVKAAADDQLAQILIVYVGGAAPDLKAAKEAFLALLDEYPLLVKQKTVGNAIAMLIGLAQDDAVKPERSESTGNDSLPNIMPTA